MTSNVCGAKPTFTTTKQTCYYYSRDARSIQKMGPWETQVDVWNTMKSMEIDKALMCLLNFLLGKKKERSEPFPL